MFWQLLLDANCCYRPPVATWRNISMKRLCTQMQDGYDERDECTQCLRATQRHSPSVNRLRAVSICRFIVQFHVPYIMIFSLAILMQFDMLVHLQIHMNSKNLCRCELRIMAHFSQDPALLALLRKYKQAHTPPSLSHTHAAIHTHIGIHGHTKYTVKQTCR